jgi:hypothetical protein
MPLPIRRDPTRGAPTGTPEAPRLDRGQVRANAAGPRSRSFPDFFQSGNIR